ncbi:nitrogenase component 1 [Hathewaya massiliensis]|uniref:nitrogenase component 1 n=1 Tax=Hathewaya massiliensis TaxID=1964382 RepID=UPI001158A2A9|nr:nitrogenase component 1 [Hathewaya massiliensis]
MNLYRYFPVPSDRMGTLWTLGSIKDAYIVEFGPAGTTHFSIEGFMQLNAQEEAKCFTTHLDESDIAFGSHERLEKAIKEVDKIHNPEVIFVMGSSITAIIGIDIKSICFMLQKEVNATLIPIDTGGFKGDFTLGVRNTIKLLCKEIVEAPLEKKAKTYNIIGSQVDYFNYKSDVNEIKEIMKEVFGYTCNCIFTSDTSLEKIKKASEAEFNIVIRSEGIDGAKILKERYNQEYILGRPYGLKNTLKWIRDIEDVIGVEGNKTYLDEKILYIEDAIMKIKTIIKENKCESTIISGYYDMVNGIYPMLKEMGFNICCGIVKHNKKGNNYFNIEEGLEDKIKINISEEEQMELINQYSPQIIVGDGALLKMSDSPIKIQISNPNLSKVLIYNRTPFIGFNGMLYMIELTINSIKDGYMLAL